MTFAEGYCFGRVVGKMTRRMDVKRLDKEELTYELTVRGIAVGSVDEMRTRLALARQMEQTGDSLHYPSYPYHFDEDENAVRKKIAEVTPLIDSFSGASRSSQFLKLQTKLSHLLNRIDNMDSEDENKRAVRGELLASVLTLINKLKSKATEAEEGTRPKPPSLDVLEGEVAGPSTAEQPLSSSSAIEQNYQSAGSHNIKPILPHKWNLKFSGDRGGLSVTAFFERVEELRRARNVGKDILLDSGIDLFEGRAYEYYQHCRSEVSSWDELANMFREEYQPAFYSEKLMDEIKRRTQGPGETIGTYLAIMAKYFQRLQCPISEEARLTILMRNIAPVYRSQLGAVEITSISQLRTLCKRIEQRMHSAEYLPPPKRNQSLEPDLAYVALEEHVNSLQSHSAPGTSFAAVDSQGGSDHMRTANQEVICYRCRKPGHRAVGCADRNTRKVCFRCRKEGFTVRTCPSCSAGNGQQRF